MLLCPGDFLFGIFIIIIMLLQLFSMLNWMVDFSLEFNSNSPHPDLKDSSNYPKQFW